MLPVTEIFMMRPAVMPLWPGEATISLAFPAPWTAMALMVLSDMSLTSP